MKVLQLLCQLKFYCAIIKPLTRTDNLCYTKFMNVLPKMQQQAGQALLLVVMILAVVLVVVLSVASRTSTDVAVTTYDENALRAFSAAEAGVEDALLRNVTTGGTPVSVDPSSNVSYSSIITIPESTDSFTHPEPGLSGQTRTFWFVSHADDNRLTCGSEPCTRATQMEVCWGTPGTPASSAETPAVEVSLYYDSSLGAVASPNNYQNVSVARFTSDPNDARRTTQNNFDSATSSCSFGGSTYAFSTGQINLSAGSALPPACPTTSGCMLMAKVRYLYNTTSSHSTGLRVFGAGALLPAQGIQVESTGTAGDSTRKVNVFRSYAEPQSIFDAGVFSLNDLTK